MKNLIIAIICIAALASCKKPEQKDLLVGTWTFNRSVYEESTGYSYDTSYVLPNALTFKSNGTGTVKFWYPSSHGLQGEHLTGNIKYSVSDNILSMRFMDSYALEVLERNIEFVDANHLILREEYRYNLRGLPEPDGANLAVFKQYFSK